VFSGVIIPKKENYENDKKNNAIGGIASSPFRTGWRFGGG
jgi:hypothetical protein